MKVLFLLIVFGISKVIFSFDNDQNLYSFGILNATTTQLSSTIKKNEQGDAVLPVEFTKKLTKNPFLIHKNLSPQRIDKVVSKRRRIGYVDESTSSIPQGTISFLVLEQQGITIPYISGKNFRYELRKSTRLDKKTKSYPIPHHVTRYQANERGESRRYLAQLSFPKVKEAGEYDLIITLKSTSLGGQAITKRLKNFFYYEQKRVSLIFVIDNSASMNRNDPNQVRYRAIYKVLKNPIFQNKVDRIALVSFSDNANIMVPFTDTRDFNRRFNTSSTRSNNSQLTRSGRGNTDFNKPFLLVKKMIVAARKQTKGSRRGRINKNRDEMVMIFLTDGSPNYPYRDEHMKIRNLGVPIYTVGLSNPKYPQEYHPEFLKKIAHESRGKFFSADSKVLNQVFKEFIELSTRKVNDFSVQPLKKSYDMDELISVSYRKKSSDQQKKTQNYKVRAYFKVNKAAKEQSLNLYFEEPGVHYFSPLKEVISSLDNKVKVSVSDVKRKGVIRLWFVNKGKTIYNQEFDVEITTDRAIKVVREPYFEQINLYKHDIRYFSVENRGQEELLVDIKSLDNINSPFGSLSFEEIPFMLAPRSKRSQMVIFPPASVVREVVDDDREKTIDNVNENVKSYYFVLKTSEGNYLEKINFDYLPKFKKTISGSPLSFDSFHISFSVGDLIRNIFFNSSQKIISFQWFFMNMFWVLFILLHFAILWWFLKWSRIKFKKSTPSSSF